MASTHPLPLPSASPQQTKPQHPPVHPASPRPAAQTRTSSSSSSRSLPPALLSLLLHLRGAVLPHPASQQQQQRVREGGGGLLVVVSWWGGGEWKTKRGAAAWLGGAAWRLSVACGVDEAPALSSTCCLRRRTPPAKPGRPPSLHPLRQTNFCSSMKHRLRGPFPASRDAHPSPPAPNHRSSSSS